MLVGSADALFFSLTLVNRAAQFVPSTPTTRTATIHQPFINHFISMPYQIRRIFETNHFLLSKIRSLCPMSTHLYPPHTYRMTRIYCFLSPLPKELDRRYLICLYCSWKTMNAFQFLVTGSTDGGTRLFNIKTGKHNFYITYITQGEPCQLCCSAGVWSAIV